MKWFKKKVKEEIKEDITEYITCNCGQKYFYVISNLKLVNGHPYGDDTLHKCISCNKIYNNYGTEIENIFKK